MCIALPAATLSRRSPPATCKLQLHIFKETKVVSRTMKKIVGALLGMAALTLAAPSEYGGLSLSVPNAAAEQGCAGPTKINGGQVKAPTCKWETQVCGSAPAGEPPPTCEVWVCKAA
jgi:hypothetical protein